MKQSSSITYDTNRFRLIRKGKELPSIGSGWSATAFRKGRVVYLTCGDETRHILMEYGNMTGDKRIPKFKFIGCYGRFGRIYMMPYYPKAGKVVSKRMKDVIPELEEFVKTFYPNMSIYEDLRPFNISKSGGLLIARDPITADFKYRGERYEIY